MAWTEERIEILKRSFFAGLPSSCIADTLGVSRNSVCGKLARMGLVRRPDPGTTRAQPMEPRAPKARGGGLIQKIKSRLRREDEPEAVVNLDPAEIPRQQRRTIHRLGERHCRFPYGTPGQADFFYCGGTKVDGLPYCPMHARIAYRPKQDHNLRMRRSGVLHPDYI